MATKQNLPPQTEEHRRRRYVVLGLGIIALAAAIYFGPLLREQEPNYYDPARTALVNARLQFEESFGHEQVLIDQIQLAHEELDSAITQLARVAELDPAYRTRIEALRASLLSIENTDHPGETNPEKLQQSYRDLLVQMDALITDLDNRGR
ncbi:MAG: hypothetical protein P8X93_05255 [Gammaproteobacteria bacterium]